MAWTVHLPTDCRLKGVAPPSEAAAHTPTGVTAAAATFTAESIVSLIGSTMGLAADSDY